MMHEKSVENIIKEKIYLIDSFALYCSIAKYNRKVNYFCTKAATSSTTANNFFLHIACILFTSYAIKINILSSFLTLRSIVKELLAYTYNEHIYYPLHKIYFQFRNSKSC